MLVVAGIRRIDIAKKKHKKIRVMEGATYIKFNTYQLPIIWMTPKYLLQKLVLIPIKKFDEKSTVSHKVDIWDLTLGNIQVVFFKAWYTIQLYE